MSVVAFVGFEFDRTVANTLGSHNGNVNASGAWAAWAKPRFVYHNKGVATLNPDTAPPQYPTSSSNGGLFYNLGSTAGS